jgi:hypothetical protein
MVLVALGLAVASLLLALQAVLSQRILSEELRATRRQLREVLERLASAERSAGDAFSQAEAAGMVLLEKGLADEEELEAARRREDPEPAHERDPRRLH